MTEVHATTETGECAGRMTRRQALMSGAAVAITRFAAGAALPALVTTIGATAAMAQAPRPNIVYIVADDMGWGDVGFHGSDITTPHLDALAKEGARLEQFYALPMCTPTRAALMTGRYPLRYGLQTGVIPGAGTYGLPLDEYLLPQMLKDAGYSTAMVGKWHLGHGKAELWPKQRGFDSFYGALVGEIDHFKHASHGVADWYRDNAPIEEEGFDNTLFANEATRRSRKKVSTTRSSAMRRRASSRPMTRASRCFSTWPSRRRTRRFKHRRTISTGSSTSPTRTAASMRQ